MKKFLLFSLYFFTKLYGSEMASTPSASPSSIRSLTPVVKEILGGPSMESFTPSSSVSGDIKDTVESKYNCCAQICKVLCCTTATSLPPFKGERQDIFTRCCDLKDCCTQKGCCEVDDVVKKSCSACFPIGMIAGLFQLCWISSSNCFHDCVTSSPEENRGECCSEPCCSRFGVPNCPCCQE